MTKRILLERQIQGMLNWKTLDKTIEMIIDIDIEAHLAKCFSVLTILGVTEISPKYKNPETTSQTFYHKSMNNLLYPLHLNIAITRLSTTSRSTDIHAYTCI